MPLVASQGSASNSNWSALGPGAVLTSNYGLVSGRISSIALDPSDTTGNHLYVGTTGGGVWMAQNAAATPSQIVFEPLTDNLTALGGVWDASISIGAVSVQPGGTGVILAGTGDPNDAMDSYYGAGILRSTDGGSTWSLISQSNDFASGLSTQNFGFQGEGFAGFAWSTVNLQVVVAAVSQAYEGTLVGAERSTYSTEGLYYSSDSGATWHLARITDGSGTDVQGPLDAFPSPDGNAATAVVWNPVRRIFIAAVRYHGYYQSADGVIWTRLTAQPGSGLTTSMCPTRAGSTGSIACPIFRGALAVNPVTGDTFAWTVDLNNQDQGLWQDQCAVSNGICTNSSVLFQQQWSTRALDTNTLQGANTVSDGVYTLALAAVPQQQATMVLAGADDWWQTSCPVSQGCTWRNATNATTCMSAQMGPFQHALEWNRANSSEIFAGNDSGLWRSMDGIAESGSPCNTTDSSHFQNLNGEFQNRDASPGSLAEVESVSPIPSSPFTLLAGLGVNGAAGTKASGVTAQWPQILGGYGGPVTIDPQDSDTWYVNDQPGVAIYRCSQAAPCTPADFGSSPLVTDSDVSGDGWVMPEPAPFMVDPLDSSQLLVGTCRLWRGPATGGWTKSNAVSPILDTGKSGSVCQGDALIRTIAAVPVSSTQEVLYAGMRGSLNGGATLPGHVLAATFDTSSGVVPAWRDLSLNPVANDSHPMNYYGLDISSVVVDPSNSATVYVTVEGENIGTLPVQKVYRSINSGATWNVITSNLTNVPVSALLIDPGDSNVVYVATDEGVFYTTGVSSCATAQANCWSQFGSGLPQAPVVALSATPASAAMPTLVAATYGRGLWQTPLWTAGAIDSAATASPSSLTFAGQALGTTSATQTITVTNTGSVALLPNAISFTGDAQDFAASGCVGQTIPASGTCPLQVTFTPQATGDRSAALILSANINSGQLSVDVSGTGLAGSSVSLAPGSLSFGMVEAGTSSAAQQATLTNLSSTSLTISSVEVSQPFVLSSNSCGATLPVNSSCQVTVAFAPAQAGSSAGELTIADSAGTQTGQLNGTGGAAPTDSLSPSSLVFPATPSGQVSASQALSISNNGDFPLHVTSISVGANFQQSSVCLSGVAAHTSCSISVSFAPAQAGNLTGALTIADDLGVRTVSLSGTALLPGVLVASPATLSFSTQLTGVTSAPQTVTVTNTGGAALANIGSQITGAAASNYSVTATTCGALLAAGAQCAVSVVFTPAASGPIAATLAISTSTAGVAAAQVLLNGAGQPGAGLTVTPALLTFSTAVGAGQTSSVQSVTVTNWSGYTITSVSPSISGPFSISGSTCSAALTIGSSCTVGVQFEPTVSGAASGALTVNAAGLSGPVAVPLIGTGFDFAVAPTGSSSLTVSSGQQADYRVLITPSGAAGTFALQCGTLPTNAICLFSPSSMTLTAGVQGNVEVEVYTGGSGLTAHASPATIIRPWPLAFAIVVMPIALRRKRKSLLMAVLAVAISAGITSCTGAIGGTTTTSTGSSGQGTTSSATPPGTYSIPVTVTSFGVSHSITVQLTVD